MGVSQRSLEICGFMFKFSIFKRWQLQKSSAPNKKVPPRDLVWWLLFCSLWSRWKVSAVECVQLLCPRTTPHPAPSDTSLIFGVAVSYSSSKFSLDIKTRPPRTSSLTPLSSLLAPHGWSTCPLLSQHFLVSR